MIKVGMCIYWQKINGILYLFFKTINVNIVSNYVLCEWG